MYLPETVTTDNPPGKMAIAPTPDRKPAERRMFDPTDPASRLFELARLLDADVSDGKRRRFAVACLARFQSHLEDPRSLRALEVAARLAEGKASEVERQQAELDAFEAHAELRQARFGGESLVPWSWRGDLLSRAATLVVTHGLYYAEDTANYARRSLGPEEAEEEAVQIGLAREFLGPHPAPRFDPAWLTANDRAVLSLARCIDEGQAFDLMPILGDALEEAGCPAGPILDHCRSATWHLRGCWVVDALLGKG
jgi:hypothetical protein